MNFKTVFPIAIVAATLGILSSLFVLWQTDISYALIFLVISSIKYPPVILLFVELKKSIEMGVRSKKLNVIEVISYFSTGLLILALLGSIGTIVNIASGYFSDMRYILVIILTVFVELACVLSLIYAYRLRRNTLGKFGVDTSNLNASDVLDNFNSEYIEETRFSTVEDRVRLCQVCTKKGFNSRVGIICSLTDAKPIFVEFCSTYIEDSKAKVLQEKMTRSGTNIEGASSGSWKGALVMSILGFVRAGMKGFDDVFGIIFLCLGVLWLIIALFSDNRR